MCSSIALVYGLNFFTYFFQVEDSISPLWRCARKDVKHHTVQREASHDIKQRCLIGASEAHYEAFIFSRQMYDKGNVGEAKGNVLPVRLQQYLNLWNSRVQTVIFVFSLSTSESFAPAVLFPSCLSMERCRRYLVLNCQIYHKRCW